MLFRSRALGLALFAAALPLVVGFGFCGPSDSPPPEPRGCDSPAPMSAITALEVGPARDPFTPSSEATREFGGQGLSMLGYRIGVQATTAVTCIALTSDGGNLSVTPSGGWFVTDTIWVITESSSTPVEVEAYGMRVERTMSLAGAAVEDASTEDAGTL